MAPRRNDKGKGKQVDAGTVALVAAGGALVWFGLGRRRRTTAGSSSGGPPSVAADVEYGQATFPPIKASAQWPRLRLLAGRAEEITGMKGLYSYLLATAKGESAGVPSAMNTKTDAGPAFRLFCKDMNYNGRYLNNPWRPASCEDSDPLAPRWSYSGGWFQIMPAVALATADKRGHQHDPARVFDPPFAVAYAADLVRRIKVGYGAQTWGDIRAGWALPKWARPDSTAEGKLVVIERFNKKLAKVASQGADPDLATKTFTSKNYPGFVTVLHELLATDGRVEPQVA